jgi:flap endonuclease-1
VRYVTISGSEFLPSQGVSRPLETELIHLNETLETLGLSRDQLIDVAILVGTDFNRGVKGIGPKRTVKLIKMYGLIERLPLDLQARLAGYQGVRELFLSPPVTDNYRVEFSPVRVDELYEFLCEERGFSRDRVNLVVRRMGAANLEGMQVDMDRWLQS